MSDNELTSEDLVASWRTTASGIDQAEETYTCAICGETKLLSLPCDHVADHGSLQGLNDDDSPQYFAGSGILIENPDYGVSVEDIVAESPPMVPSGVLFGTPPAADAPEMLVSGLYPNQPQFQEYAYVNQPADQNALMLSTLGDGEFTLSQAQPNALVLDDGNGGGVKINFNGEVEYLGGTDPVEAAQLFWDLVQVEGINSKNQMEILQKENQELADRVKELEVKLGYRKQTEIEKPDDRFEGILDES